MKVFMCDLCRKEIPVKPVGEFEYETVTKFSKDIKKLRIKIQMHDGCHGYDAIELCDSCIKIVKDNLITAIGKIRGVVDE